MSASDDEVGRYLERQANRRLAHAVDRAREHAEHAHIVAKLALETAPSRHARLTSVRTARYLL